MPTAIIVVPSSVVQRAVVRHALRADRALDFTIEGYGMNPYGAEFHPDTKTATSTWRGPPSLVRPQILENFTPAPPAPLFEVVARIVCDIHEELIRKNSGRFFAQVVWGMHGHEFWVKMGQGWRFVWARALGAD
jgi:hypothetical protein